MKQVLLAALLALGIGQAGAIVLPVNEVPKLQRIAIMVLYNGVHGHLLINNETNKCQWNIHSPEQTGNQLLQVLPTDCPDGLKDIFLKLSI